MSKVKLGLGAALGIFAGAHFLFGNSENAKRNAKKLQGFAIKMKGDVIEKLEKAKQISEPIYNQIVDDVSKKYSKIEKMQISEIVAELKKHGKKILKDVKAEVGDLTTNVKKEVAKAPSKTSKKVAVKKPVSKTTTKTIVNKKAKSKTVANTAPIVTEISNSEMAVTTTENN